MKKLVSFALCAALLVTLLTGCIPDSREFTCQDLTMEVPLLMKDVSSDSAYSSFAFALDSSEVAIFGIKEEFSIISGGADMSTMDYAKTVIEVNGHDSLAISRSNEDYVYFTFEANLEAGLFKYVAGCYKGSDAFWMVQFGGPAKNFELETYLGYLDTVTLS